MSYRGRPSRGCKRCVGKKVKCDQTQPVCQRCLKANATCEYRDGFDLVHRSQTQTAERTAKEKWRQRSAKAASTDDDASLSPNRKSTSPESTVAHRAASVPAQMSLHPSLERLAYTRFVYDFASPHVASPNGRQGAFEPLPKLFETSAPDSPLYFAISAVALANFGARFKSADATTRGAVYHGKALSTFAAAVGGGRGRLPTQEALLAIFLLGNYEILTSSTFDGTYRMHQRGAMSVLRERWDDGALKHGYKNRYLSVILSQLLLNAISEGRPPPIFDPKWNLYDNDTPRGELSRLMNAVAISRHNLISESSAPVPPKDESSPDSIATDNLLDAALEVDAQLEEWRQRTIVGLSWIADAAAPIYAERRPSWAKELFGLPGAPKVMHLYKNIIFALSCNTYCGVRVYLNISILRRAAQRAADSPVGSRQRLYLDALVSSTAQLLMGLVDEICLSVPCLLQIGAHGDGSDPATPDEIYGFRGQLVFWPLIAAMMALVQESVRRLDVNLRRAWIICVMALLRNSLGVAKAEAVMKAPYPETPFPAYRRLTPPA